MTNQFALISNLQDNTNLKILSINEKLAILYVFNQFNLLSFKYNYPMNPERSIMNKSSRKKFIEKNEHYSNSVPIKLNQIQQSYYGSSLKIPIKINKNKLPIDFFPKREERNIKLLPNIIKKDNLHLVNITSRAESERKNISPQRTSFFGFFNEEQNKNIASNKRINQSSKYPKRQIINRPNFRNLTPLTISQKSDILQLYPVNYEIQIQSPISANLKYKKISPRKQHQSKYYDRHQQGMDNQSTQLQKANLFLQLKQSYCLGEQIRYKNNNEVKQQANLTFYNVKSVSYSQQNNKKQQDTNG